MCHRSDVQRHQGAKLRSSNQVSHRFSLTFDPHVEEVSGVHGILKAYRKTFGKIQLSGRGEAADVLNERPALWC